MEDHVRDANALARHNIDLGLQSVIDHDIFLSDDVKRLIRIDDDGRVLIDSNPQQFGILGDQTDELALFDSDIQKRAQIPEGLHPFFRLFVAPLRLTFLVLPMGFADGEINILGFPEI